MKERLKLPNGILIKEMQLKIREIADFLVELDDKNELNPGLFCGNTGISLFLFHYAKYSKEAHYADVAMDFLSCSVKNIDKSYNHTFCGGISGICWCIHYLIENQLIDDRNEEILDLFDVFLCNQSSLSLFRDKNPDYLHGAIGTANYLLKRVKKNIVKTFEEKLINGLGTCKISRGNMCYWEYKIGNKCNISLSHGMASMCIFLSNVYALGIRQDLVRNLLDESVSFLLSQEVTESNRISMFPSYFLRESHLNINKSRLGWCYGDLGIALALWHCSQACKDKILEQKSIKIFLFESKRKDLQENYVIDASICHGTSGIALIFRRMYLNTGLDEFKQAAIYWLEQTLRMSKYEDGYVGYKANQEICSEDFLNGISGIGMVLLSFLMNDATWDECLLIN